VYATSGITSVVTSKPVTGTRSRKREMLGMQ